MSEIKGKPNESGVSILSQVPPCVAKVCYENDGVVTSMFMTPKCIDQVRNFKVRPDDLFIFTYPKTGTTWVQQIAYLVKCEGDLSQLEGTHIMKVVPFLETLDCMDPAEMETAQTWAEIADAMPTDTPRILKSHVVPRWLPKELREDPKAKIIYVARNPKDTAVSFYHFHTYMKGLPEYASWDEFLEEFMCGRVAGGDWFEHTLFGWKLRDHPNVLYLTYEGMKEDSRKAVVQIAEFMDKKLSDDIIDKIVDACSFKAMKGSPSSGIDKPYRDAVNASGNNAFFRKGVVGDWKNYFTVNQSRRFDELYKEKVGASGLKLVSE